MTNKRQRRLRNSATLRKMVRETRISSEALILPFFIREGTGITEEISSLDGHCRYSADTVTAPIEDALKKGLNKFLLFGIPDEKDETGTGAYAEDGVIQKATAFLKKRYGKEIFLITDVCLCEYTSHGHCGIVEEGEIDNDASVKLIAKTALSHIQAGSDMVAPSDMMDGRVGAIRNTLDENGFFNAPIMSYTKFASAFYGPFREAAGSTPQFGDRKTYQMDCHNGREAVKTAITDVEQGADIVIVKPALSYLDVISDVSKQVGVPVAGYSVSGEYAMIKAAAKQNLIDEYNTMCETAASVFRAGADILITYFAPELAQAIKNGDIG